MAPKRCRFQHIMSIRIPNDHTFVWWFIKISLGICRVIRFPTLFINKSWKTNRLCEWLWHPGQYLFLHLPRGDCPTCLLTKRWLIHMRFNWNKTGCAPLELLEKCKDVIPLQQAPRAAYAGMMKHPWNMHRLVNFKKLEALRWQNIHIRKGMVLSRWIGVGSAVKFSF